jgi:predicted dehydrogenase
MKKIGFGIVGIGKQGLRLAEHIRKDLRSGELVAVCRRSESGIDYAEKQGIKFYSDYRNLLKDEDIEAVIITTPSSLHGRQALDALKLGRHILVDKPFASTVDEGKKILAVAKKEKLTVGINFPLRVNPVTEALRGSLKNIGKLNKIHVIVSHGPIRSHWQRDLKLSGGGVILDLGSHYFDLVSYLSKTHPTLISAAYSEKSENENSGFIDATYKNFSLSMVILRNQKVKKSVITIAGDEGFLLADYIGREVIMSNNHKVDEKKFPQSHDCKIILNNMVEAIRGNEKIIADAEAGLDSLRTIRAVYEALKTSKGVRL